MYGRDERTGKDYGPRPYQDRVAKLLAERKNVVLTAPTGAGKTRAILAPFFALPEIGARRLIYCLPMKTLAEGILAEARSMATPLGKRVTIQTGERPEDPFFTEGDVVVCTYDQFLSGLLCGPYSLSDSQHNINAAVAAGNLIVFDEFHLMEADKAFLTGVAGMRLFGAATRSVWMTATATTPLRDYLVRRLPAVAVDVSAAEAAEMAGGRIRRLECVDEALTVEAIFAEPGARTLVVANTVGRAQELFRRVQAEADRRDFPVANRLLIHSRFFAGDRQRKRSRLYELFGKDAPRQAAIAVATQVVEAGLDLSADRLLTELCPMNALVQRAGRCARFRGEQGKVVVYRGEGYRSLPYRADACEETWKMLAGRERLDDVEARAWVNSVHEPSDALALRRNPNWDTQCADAIRDGVRRQRQGSISSFIRTSSPSIAVVLAKDPTGTRPSEWETLTIRRSTLHGLWKGGLRSQTFDPDKGWKPMENPSDGYVVCLSPENAEYTEDLGLVAGKVGRTESPRCEPPVRFRPFTYREETWVDHTEAVAAEAARLLNQEMLAGGLLDEGLDGSVVQKALRWAALLHDLGKLQGSWQAWAEKYGRLRDPSYRPGPALAHTESRTEADRELAKKTGRKPLHSEASAFYGQQALDCGDSSIGESWRMAIVGAVAAHHGGWLQGEPIDRLDGRAPSCLSEVGVLAPGLLAPSGRSDLDKLKERFKILDEDADFRACWGNLALLTRFLRLSDQKATAAGASE